MKNVFAGVLVGIMAFVASGASLTSASLRGGDDCDSKQLGDTSCVNVVPGCTKTYKVCQSGQPAERKFICNVGQGAAACYKRNDSNCVGGVNNDAKSSVTCDTPEPVPVFN